MFEDSANKQAIRRRWDLPILRAAVNRRGTPLSYFGMPGAEIVDLLDWSDALDSKTCVQIVRRSARDREEDLETLRKMKSNLMIRGVENWQVLRGAIEDVIIRGTDMDRNVPLKIAEFNGEHRFQYSLYNLDFLGGIAYKAKVTGDSASKSTRVRALETLFLRQRGTEFTLLLTINVRDTFGIEPITFFREEAARSNSATLTSISSWLNQLDSGSKHHLLRHWIPLWIRSISEMQGFKCDCLPPVFYVGHENARMVHFVFNFEFIEGRELRVASDQCVEDIAQLPFLCVQDGEFLYLSAAGDPMPHISSTYGQVSDAELTALSVVLLPGSCNAVL